MSQAILSKKTEENLKILKNQRLLQDFYLAGGTGLAFHFQHRLSLDLDFFTKKDFNSQILIQKLKDLGEFSLEQEAENTLTGIFNETKLTFLGYQYPLLFPLKEIGGIKVADIKDIGCMKLTAVSSRGTKKDFIDLFFICKKIIPLRELLELFRKKYEDVDYNQIHILKSLIYFKDAEKDPIPKMTAPISWQEIKSFFKKEVKNLAQ